MYQMGVTWFRRRLQNLKGMPRWRSLVKYTQINLNAKNDANFEGVALAA